MVAEGKAQRGVVKDALPSRFSLVAPTRVSSLYLSHDRPLEQSRAHSPA